MRIEEALDRKTEFFLRPRYAETDQMGVVYYANYLVWFECARTEWLRDVGMTYAGMEAQGVFLPARRSEITYHASALYDREIVVEATVRALTPVRVEFVYRVVDRAENKLLAEGVTVHAFTDADGKLTRRGFEALGIEK